MKNIIKTVIEWVVISIGKVHWSYKNGLTEAELAKVQDMLTADYYIILTRRNNHLSTYLTSIVSFILSRKWGYWAHALMNTENIVNDKRDFRLVEATGNGVHYSSFVDVFSVNSVSLLKPVSMSTDRWTFIIEKLLTELGKPYDSLFDLSNDSALSCVELVRAALMAEPGYAENFANFEEMISAGRNLTPDMFYNCPDFEISYEIRH